MKNEWLDVDVDPRDSVVFWSKMTKKYMGKDPRFPKLKKAAIKLAKKKKITHRQLVKLIVENFK